MRFESGTPVALLARRILTIVIASGGLVWGIIVLPGSPMTDALAETEGRLLRFEMFKETAFEPTLENPASRNLNACQTKAQTALLLMEMPLAAAALKSGASQEFDRRIQSLETRARGILGCAPRDSFAWLVLFNVDALHGRLDQDAFNLLAMSYATSPNEAWISIRRNRLAVPLVAAANEPLRKTVFFEFLQLIRYDFQDSAALSYLAASQPIRSALQAEVERLPAAQQKAFSEALRNVGL